MKLLKSIHYENLLLLLAVQLIFRYGFLEQQGNLPLALTDKLYILFMLASVLIAASGLIIEKVSGNDKYNAAITEDQGYNIFITCNLVALTLGGYLSYYIGNIQFITGFVIGSGMLYIASTNWRTSLLVPNILISLATALSIIMIGIFHFYPFMQLQGHEFLTTIFEILLDYAYFAFIITFMLTLVNDLKNTDADYNAGKNTLPIALGRERAAKILFFLAIIPAAMIVYYANTYLIDLIYALGYTLLFVLGPLIYFAIKLWSAKTPKDFNHLAVVLKLLMLFAAISIAVITYNIQHNA